MKQQESKVPNNCLSDEKIIELYWNRNEDAIKETDKKYGGYLYTVAYNILSDRLDCEECLNDTYLGTWHRIPPTKPNVFQLFLSKITRNIAVDKFRNKSATKRISSGMLVSLSELDECISYPNDAIAELALAEMVNILNSYLRQLSSRQEFIFICRYYYADTVANIAKMLDLGESTVYRELADIRNGLKAKMKEGGWYNE